MLPTPAAPRLARSNGARRSSGAVHHFNPLVNRLTQSSWAAAKPLQPLPLPPRGRATMALAKIWCSLCSLRGRGCAASCHARRAPPLPPFRSHGCARIARERSPGWILACLLGRLLQREQDHRPLDRMVTDVCKTYVAALQSERMSLLCIAVTILVAAEAVARRESATCWSYACQLPGQACSGL